MAGDSGTRVHWRKSKRSGVDGCVECALESELVGVRDSKDPTGPELAFDHATWRAFIDDLKRGHFDR
jgi:Domain of unknown function (DUF397)